MFLPNKHVSPCLHDQPTAKSTDSVEHLRCYLYIRGWICHIQATSLLGPMKIFDGHLSLCSPLYDCVKVRAMWLAEQVYFWWSAHSERVKREWSWWVLPGLPDKTNIVAVIGQLWVMVRGEDVLAHIAHNLAVLNQLLDLCSWPLMGGG